MAPEIKHARIRPRDLRSASSRSWADSNSGSTLGPFPPASNVGQPDGKLASDEYLFAGRLDGVK